jgi:hypothetical protein
VGTSGPPAFKGRNRVIHVSLRAATVCSGAPTCPPASLDPTSGHQPEAYKTPRGFRANVTTDIPAEAEHIYHALAKGGTIAARAETTTSKLAADKALRTPSIYR